MLQYQTIYPATLQLLKDLQSLELLKECRLVGGTAEDAEADPMPVMFEEVSWPDVKALIGESISTI